MDAGIALGFITWMVIIFMVVGIVLIKMFEVELKNPDPQLDVDEEARMSLEMLVNTYYSNDFAGKVLFVTKLGAKFLASPFNIKGQEQWKIEVTRMPSIEGFLRVRNMDKIAVLSIGKRGEKHVYKADSLQSRISLAYVI